MRSTRILPWAAAILLTSILVAGLLIAFFFPWEALEDGLEGTLNARLAPLRVELAGLRPFLREGPGIAIDEVRIFGSGSGEGPALSGRGAVVRASILHFRAREIAVRIGFERLAVRGDPGGDGTGMIATVLRGLAKGGGRHPASENLPELVPLPFGLALTRAALDIPEGSLHAGPSSGLSEARAALRIDRDLSFQAKLENGVLRWQSEPKGPFRLSAVLGAEVRGRLGSAAGGHLEGRVRFRDTEIEGGRGTATFSAPMAFTFRLEAGEEGRLAVPRVLLTGPGLEIGMAGSTRWGEEGAGRVEIRNLRAKIENWEPLNALLSAEDALAGRLSVVAGKLDVEPERFALPAFRKGPFLPEGPEGLSCEGLEVRLTEGRLARTQIGRTSVRLDGLELSLEQRDGGWTGAVRAAELRAGRGEAVRFCGPAAIRMDWSEEQSLGRASLAVDLTRGRLLWQSLLDKPPHVSLQLEARARIRREELLLDRASLRLGDTKWAFGGAVREPARPLLRARLEPNTISLASLAEVFPAARELDLRGDVEVKELGLSARLREFGRSARLRARMAGKDLAVRGTSLEGLYAQAVYREQLLTVRPVVIQPKTGMVELVFSSDFSETFLNAGLHEYYGNLRVDHVAIDDLTRVVAPGLAGRARGTADVNLAFRGSGFSRAEAQAALEARARVRLNGLVLDEREGPEEGPAEGRAGWFEALVRETGDGGPGMQGEERTLPKQEALLQENRAAGCLTVREGRIHTDNLVAIHDGRLIQVRGSIDTEGHLEVERGRIFAGGMRVPFRVDCVITDEGCEPVAVEAESEASPAEELSAALEALSEAARNVYQDLNF